MNALTILNSARELVFIDPQGDFILRDDMTEREWAWLGPRIFRLQDDLNWLLGAWLEFGKQKMQHWRKCDAAQASLYAMAQARTGLAYSTLRNISSIYSRSNASRRKELSFTHHEAVASEEPATQRKWLDRAVKEQLTVSDLRMAIRSEACEFHSPRAAIKHDDFPAWILEAKRWFNRQTMKTWDMPRRQAWQQLTADLPAAIQSGWPGH